jgi:hypothetical protein
MLMGPEAFGAAPGVVVAIYACHVYVLVMLAQKRDPATSIRDVCISFAIVTVLVCVNGSLASLAFSGPSFQAPPQNFVIAFTGAYAVSAMVATTFAMIGSFLSILNVQRIIYFGAFRKHVGEAKKVGALRVTHAPTHIHSYTHRHTLMHSYTHSPIPLIPLMHPYTHTQDVEDDPLETSVRNLSYEFEEGTIASIRRVRDAGVEWLRVSVKSPTMQVW